MSDDDDLRGRFAEFRVGSLARTVPPGVVAARRQVVRRRVRRTSVAALVAAALVAVAVWVPDWTLRAHPDDVLASTQPSPAPTIGDSPSPSAPVVLPPGERAAACSIPPTKWVSPWGSRDRLDAVALKKCPDIEVHYYQATYHWSSTLQAVVLYKVAEVDVLNAGHPRITVKPQWLPKPPDSNSCGWLAVTFYYDGVRPVPTIIPSPYPSYDAYKAWWGQHVYMWVGNGFYLLTPGEMKSWKNCPNQPAPGLPQA
jgi:hypothetical protein